METEPQQPAPATPINSKSMLPYAGVAVIILIVIGICYYLFAWHSALTPSATSTVQGSSTANTSNPTTSTQASSNNKSFSPLSESLMGTFVGKVNTYHAYNLTNASQYSTTGYNLSYEDSVYPFNKSITGGWYVTANSSSSTSITLAGEFLFYTNESQYAESVMYNNLLNQTSIFTYTGSLNISNGTIGNMHYNIITYYPTPSQQTSRPQIWFFAYRGNSVTEVVVDQEVAGVNKTALNETGHAIINAVSTS